MASDHSFDIVSEIDMQELSNALDQTRKEIAVRYDFKGVPVEILNKDEKDKKELVITTQDDYKLKAVMDMLESKLLKRGLDLKILGTPKNESASGGQVRSTIPLVAGVSQEKAKVINKMIRDSYPKVKTQIQGETVRVTSSSIDDLQAVMALLKASPQVDIPIQFENYR
jgi:cyclic-di-GMP-binding protein